VRDVAISADLNSKEVVGRRAAGSRVASRRGMAFLLEALITLAFLMGCLAVFVRLFSSAQLEALKANKLSRAVVAATNRAEEFSANPFDTSSTTTKDGLTVECRVRADERPAGTLFEATIIVLENKSELYRLETSRYVSGAEAGDLS